MIDEYPTINAFIESIFEDSSIYTQMDKINELTENQIRLSKHNDKIIDVILKATYEDAETYWRHAFKKLSKKDVKRIRSLEVLEKHLFKLLNDGEEDIDEWDPVLRKLGWNKTEELHYETEPCKECNGTGKIWKPVCEGASVSESFKCESCGGGGGKTISRSSTGRIIYRKNKEIYTYRKKSDYGGLLKNPI